MSASLHTFLFFIIIIYTIPSYLHRVDEVPFLLALIWLVHGLACTKRFAWSATSHHPTSNKNLGKTKKLRERELRQRQSEDERSRDEFRFIAKMKFVAIWRQVVSRGSSEAVLYSIEARQRPLFKVSRLVRGRYLQYRGSSEAFRPCFSANFHERIA